MTRPARAISVACGLLSTAAPAAALSSIDHAPATGLRSGVSAMATPLPDSVAPAHPGEPRGQVAAVRARHSHHHRARRPRHARVTGSGLAIAPAGAPARVKRIIRAGNRIALTPYVWGGGHGSWTAPGYDCSGSVGYALHGARLLKTATTSGALAGYGRPGRGRWVTIYANGGHVYMVVAGLRFDTSARGAHGSRWTRVARGTSGYAERHPDGL